MTRRVILTPHLTEKWLIDLNTYTWLTDIEIDSRHFWEELIERGFDPEKWSKKNHGNKIYLKQ